MAHSHSSADGRLEEMSRFDGWMSSGTDVFNMAWSPRMCGYSTRETEAGGARPRSCVYVYSASLISCVSKPSGIVSESTPGLAPMTMPLVGYIIY